MSTLSTRATVLQPDPNASSKATKIVLVRMPTIVTGSRNLRKILKALAFCLIFVTGCTRPNLEAGGGGGDLGGSEPHDLSGQPAGDGGSPGGKDGGGQPGANDYA